MSVVVTVAAESRWQQLRRTLATPSAAVMLVFGFGSGLPFLPLGWVLSTWLREVGFDLATIGLISFVSWFYVVKFLWAPLLDRVAAPGLGRLGRRRGWLAFAQIGLIVGFGLLALVGADGPLPTFLLLLALTTWAGASQDIVVDAYRIEIAPVEAQGALIASYQLGYRLGLILGGAGVLLVADRYGWPAAYAMLAGSMLLPLLTSLRAAEPALPEFAEVHSAADPQQTPWLERTQAAFIEPFQDFLTRHGHKLALLLLVFVGLYKMPDQMLGVLAGPFYIDSGFSKSQIATVSKLYGVWIGLAGAFVGGVALALIGQRLALFGAALAVALSNLLYLLMAQHPGATWAFVATISGDNFAQGFAGVVLVAFMSGLTSPRHTATQFALLTSFANLSGKLVGGLSGFIVQASSYTVFFLISAVSIVPTLALLALLWRRIGPHAQKS
ncbi:MAG: MFS transporter [Lysobacterales bacterium]